MNRNLSILLIPGAFVFLFLFFYFLNFMFSYFFPDQSLLGFLAGGLPKGSRHLLETRVAGIFSSIYHLFARLFSIALWIIVLGMFAVVSLRMYFRFLRAKSLKTVELVLSRDDTATPFEVMGALDSIYGNLIERFFRLFKGQDHFVWEVVKSDSGIKFYITAPASKLEAIKKRFQSTYQNLRFNDGYPDHGQYQILQQYKLARPWFYTLKSLRDYQSSITESLVNVLDSAVGVVRLQVILIPAPLSFQQQVKNMQISFEREHLSDKIYDQSSPGIGYTEDKELKGSLELIGKGFFIVELRLSCDSWSTAQGVAGVFSEASSENRIVPPNFFGEIMLRIFRKLWLKWLVNRMPAILLFRGFYLSSFHLATLIHLPSVRVRVATLNRYPVRRAIAPMKTCRDSEKAILCDEEGYVGINEEDRKFNILMLGGQGMGKSTTMENIIRNDARDLNKAIIVIDPNNDLAAKALGLIPPNREVIYLNVADVNNRLGINPFSSDDVPDLLVTNVISNFKQFWGKEAIGPRSEELLINTMYALLDALPSVTFYEVYRMMADFNYRTAIISQLTDDHQRLYWQHTFEAMSENEKFLEEALSAPRNKLNRILSVSNVRRVLTSRYNIDLKELIAKRRVLVVNLAKGAVGEENAYLLGVFLVTMLWQAIQSQVVLQPEKRIPVSLVVDEAHNFLCPGLEKLLSEGRKFGGQNTLAFQFMGQIEYEKVKKAVMNLAQNIILFRTEELEDAENFSKIFMRLYSNMIQVSDEVQDRLNFGPDDILNLPAYKAIARLVSHGEVTAAFLAETIPTKYNSKWANHHFEKQSEFLPEPEPVSVMPLVNINNGHGSSAPEKKNVDAAGKFIEADDSDALGVEETRRTINQNEAVGAGNEMLKIAGEIEKEGCRVTDITKKKDRSKKDAGDDNKNPIEALANKAGVSMEELNEIIMQAGADQAKGEKVAAWVLTRPDFDKIKKPHLLFKSILSKKTARRR
ncbi:MAG: AAA-like domain protein [Pelotomaculum sp. PtaU1.Bin065]|nr:MAG: AAA-like domain protein [Pelotomaculum sp. PtaU1.Bin065]